MNDRPCFLSNDCLTFVFDTEKTWITPAGFLTKIEMERQYNQFFAETPVRFFFASISFVVNAEIMDRPYDANCVSNAVILPGIFASNCGTQKSRVLIWQSKFSRCYITN